MIKYLLTAGLSLFIVSNASFAQVKLGHINSQELLALMPESDSAKVNIEKEVKQLEDQLELMQVEYNKKLEQYVKEKATYSPLILQTKEAELSDLQQRIQAFQQTAQQEIQRKQQELFQPVLDKANKAIEEVGRENGFTYILDISTGVVLFHADNSIDVTPLVKAKLNIKK